MIEYRFTPAETIGDGVENLYQILRYLRCPEGCPWDRKQTNKTVTACMLDEVYEYLDGIQKDSVDSCREEIGDVMINVFMTQLIHEEQHDFTPTEALNEVCEKLIRRHPHVFGDMHVENEMDATGLWNSIKTNVEGHEEKPDDIFEHIAESLPPMEEAYEIQKKMKKTCFEYPTLQPFIDKVKEELSALEKSMKEDDMDKQEDRVGDLLFAAVTLSGKLGVRPNIALKRCNDRIKRQFQKMFDIATQKNIPVNSSNLRELEKIWNSLKASDQ